MKEDVDNQEEQGVSKYDGMRRKKGLLNKGPSL